MTKKAAKKAAKSEAKDVITMRVTGKKLKAVNLPLDVLKIDLATSGGYQRGPKHKVRAMAEDFSTTACGALIVGQRVNGAYYVVDGGQRLRAMLMNGALKMAPCLVFQSDGRKEEAAVYTAINRDRTTQTQIDHFYSSVCAHEEPYYTAAKWLHDNGFDLLGSSRTPVMIACVGTMMAHWHRKPEACQSALCAERDITPDAAIHSYIHKGFFWLLRYGIDPSDHIQKLQRFARNRILGSIGNKKECSPSKTATPEVCGWGILDLINTGRRVKIRPSAHPLF